MTNASSDRPRLAAIASGSQRYVQLDDEGYFHFEGQRVADAEIGADWLSRIRMDSRCRAILSVPGEADAIVEAFDDPYVARSIERPEDPAEAWTAIMPYGFRASFRLESLNADEWDRFHGRAENGVPFVLSRSAQAAFFELVDEFDDDSVTIAGRRIQIEPWLPDVPSYDAPETWTSIYRNEDPGWELGAASPVLAAVVPRLKLQKGRVLVLGCGTGNDAAFFAEMGHIVTAVDFSEEAIARAQAKYGHVKGLRFLQADAFQLPSAMHGAFDLIVEHTLYCAVIPSRRNELVRAWRRYLAPGGHLLGVFFTIDKRTGPPFGGSEWELRARLQKSFRPLYWMRSRHSLEKRAGQETLIFAQKIERL